MTGDRRNAGSTDAQQQYRLFIGGQSVDPCSRRWFDSEDPFTGRAWASIPHCDSQDVDRAVDAASEAFRDGPWSRMSAAERGRLLVRVGQLAAERAELLAQIETRDTGKRLVESLPQMRALADWFFYYGGLADKVEGRVVPSDPARSFNYTLREPLGVVVAITPWNSPVMIGTWKIAPALAAGNTVVIKPSEHASASTLALMELFRDAGFPPGVVNVVTGFPDECGERLVAHPKVAKISFTGSDTGGRAINRRAAGDFKRVTMELGGKSPQVVFADADLDNAVHGVMAGVFLSNGQTCVAGSRLLLERGLADAFLEQLVNKVSGLRMGDPFDQATQIGPIANRAQFERVLEFIDETTAAGARCLYGGRTDEHRGLFVKPTIFTGVRPDMRIAREEVFGPVLAVMTFDDEQEAVAMANDTPYGLAAGVWTTDMYRAQRLIRGLECGTVYVNTYRSVATASPVGGYKASGFGRENGIEAMDEFLQTKCVWIGTDEHIPDPLGGSG